MNRSRIVGGLAGVAIFVLSAALIGGALSDPDCSPTSGSTANACETTTTGASSTEATDASGGVEPTNSAATQPGTRKKLSDTLPTDTSSQPANPDTTQPANPDTTQPPSTATTESSDTTTGGSGDCSIVLGMSQINQVYEASSLHTSGEWMSHISEGTPLGQWADSSGRPWVSFKIRDDCGDPTHASFGFDPGGRALDPYLSTAVANIKNFYPTVETVDAWLLVGAKENGQHVICTMNGESVRATVIHASYQEEFATFFAQHPDILAGPDIDVSCDGFRDTLGHLSASGEAEAGAQFDAFYR